MIVPRRMSNKESMLVAACLVTSRAKEVADAKLAAFNKKKERM